MSRSTKINANVKAEMRQLAKMGLSYTEVAKRLNAAMYKHPTGRQFDDKDVSSVLLSMGIRKHKYKSRKPRATTKYTTAPTWTTPKKATGLMITAVGAGGGGGQTKDFVETLWQSLDREKKKQLVKTYIDQC